MPQDEEEQQEPEGYRKVDRRHSAEEEPAAEPQASAGQEPAGASETAAEEQAEASHPAMSLADLGVYDLLRFSLELFVHQAWIAMGVQKAPGAEDVHTELGQAKVAIETVRALAAQLEPDADAAEHREMQQIISNLQINFVQRS